MFKSLEKLKNGANLDPFLGLLRKGLHTLRNPSFQVAQFMRSRFPVLGFIPFVALFCLQPGLAKPLHQEFEVALSHGRVFLFNPEGQTWQIGSVGKPLSEPRRIPSPKGMFRPLHIFPGPAGGVYVQDAIEPRLCLLDTAGQLLSCRHLPENYSNRRPDRILIIPRKDGRFVFIDLDKGDGAVWREASSGEFQSQSQWQMGTTSRMQAGIRQCWESPWYKFLCCETHSNLQCFDSFLNPLPTQPDSTWWASSQIQIKRHESEAGRSILFLPENSDQVAWCFDSLKGFAPCP